MKELPSCSDLAVAVLERKEPDSSWGRVIPPSAMGYVVAGALSALNLVYCTLVFAFHTLYDSNFAECPSHSRELVSAPSLQARLRDPTCWSDPTHTAAAPPQVLPAGERPQDVGSRECLVPLTHVWWILNRHLLDHYSSNGLLLKNTHIALTGLAQWIERQPVDSRVNDTIQIDLETDRITDCIKFDAGNLCMVTGGANLGRIGMITNRERHPGSFDGVHVKDANGNSFAAQLSNSFVTGKGNKPWISLPRGKGICLTIAEERDKRLAAK
ncbi:40S ribosomal protein S4 [Myotis davidii]|uniref:40S ribosomal protein S4 n=1 Tax=Myotis davidii TaxID=225400 RepID=L5MDY2_MYODS|nr:40S ribosomal protein S4 [Myotis davidii]